MTLMVTPLYINDLRRSSSDSGGHFRQQQLIEHKNNTIREKRHRIMTNNRSIKLPMLGQSLTSDLAAPDSICRTASMKASKLRYPYPLCPEKYPTPRCNGTTDGRGPKHHMSCRDAWSYQTLNKRCYRTAADKQRIYLRWF